MSEILTRLKLDTKNFDANLNKSKRYTKNWKNNSNSVMKGLTSSIMKLGGAMGAVALATKTFNAVIKSSQAIGDKYAETQAQATSAVGEFFYAVANGDLSGFNQGLDGLIKKAGDAYRAMDQLGNTMISFDWSSSGNLADITEAQADFQAARSAGDKKGMDAALVRWQTAMKKQADEIESVKETTWEAVSKEVTKTTELESTDISIDDIIKIRDIDTSTPLVRDSIKNQLAKRYDEYKDLSQEYANKYQIKGGSYVQSQGNFGGGTLTKTGTADPVKQNELAQGYKDAILYNQLLAKYTDDELTSVFTKLKQVDVLSRQLSKQQKTFETSRVQGVVTPTTTAPIEEVTKKGYDSLAALQERLKEANAQLMEASTTSARVAAQDLVDDIEGKVIHMKATITYTKNVSSDDDFSSNMAGIPLVGDKQPTKLGNTSTPTIGPVVDDSAIDTNNKYTDSLMAITNVMGNLGGAVDDSAQGWLSWGANLLTAIAAAIPAIGALSVANTVQGATAKDAAIAESAKSVAATPFVGPILAVAAIASMIAAFVAIPKFATGGIVPGNSFSGDKVPAMVNSGELILNEAQQGNLANKLTTNRSTQNVNVGGSFVLRGKDLIATITKNNRIISRT